MKQTNRASSTLATSASSITTIEWYTLPRNGNGGAAIVWWRASTLDSQRWTTHSDGNDIGYLLGDKPARYPVPAINQINPLIEAYIMKPIYDWLMQD